MNPLAVIHSDPHQSDIRRYILHEAVSRLQEGEEVYLLSPSTKYETPNLELLKGLEFDMLTRVPSFLNETNRRVVNYRGKEFTGKKNYSPQFLLLKSQLIQDGFEEVDLIGGSREHCIPRIENLMRASLPHRILQGDEYRKAAAYLGLEDFATTFKKKIRTQRINDLIW